MFNAINEGGLNQILTRRLAMQGGASAPAVAPELFPTIATEVDRVEWGFLKGERLGAIWLQLLGGAGLVSMAQLYFPSTTAEIGVIEEVQNNGTNPLYLARGIGISAGLAGWTAFVTATRDGRWGGGLTSMIVETNTNAAFPATFAAIAELRQGQSIRNPFVVTPGTSLILFSDVLNANLSANIQWRERAANPGELV